MKTVRFFLAVVAFALLFFSPALGRQPAQDPAQPEQPAASEDPALALVKQGQKLNAQGRQDEALALYRKALETSPDLYEARLAAGIALDLKGDYAEARRQFAFAIRDTDPKKKQQALRAMAVSYAFEGKADEAAKNETRVLDQRMADKDFTGAAEIADELARIYLESGDLDNAYKWYETGHITADRQPNLTAQDKALWEFRWQHAQARIAARRGQKEEAQKHVALAKAALDAYGKEDQRRFYPYLTGYVALYTSDYPTAIADLKQADELAEHRDPFILALLAQAYEKSGDERVAEVSADIADQYYRQILKSNAHNPTNAFARPLAKQKLAQP